MQGASLPYACKSEFIVNNHHLYSNLKGFDSISVTMKHGTELCKYTANIFS